ncbi:molybdenum cofactor biosynthesis protein MoaE [Bremerella sp. P1]|uniref:molybdenum cofactor biosynthesis protein MoaE n=1 Tax=Bremerella sp. P1 TaxID=3026424 RepID=UPI0023688F37|nr:molybdenum cofactor biosynthesis protein MoaE [Bremerella sp. P1]WDI40960.1 molybdenum cofactor biosynthesis protein MoaE [Bremerella sp. P1]
MVELTQQSIDASAVTQTVTSPNSGAVVLFLGTTRQFTDAKETVTLTYTAYVPMATSEMEKLEAEAKARWPIDQCVLIHRLGEVPIGEASVAVAVSTPHRRDAFEAASWLMDRLKELVPVWKKEHWASGSTDWVHPGLVQRSDENTLQ